jgi:peptide/nickel transport system permease protein
MEVQTTTPTAAASTPARKGAFRIFLSRLFKEKPLGAVGGVIVLVFLFVGVSAPLLAPQSLFKRNLRSTLQGPSVEFPLGTDHMGRDLLTRVLYGARMSMVVGLTATTLAVGLATFLGLISGYFGGRVDLVLQRFVDAWLSIPWLFLVLTIMSVLGQGMVQIIVLLGLSWGMGNVRTMRGVVLSIKENVYVEAARAVGCSTWRILWRHILLQLVAPIIVLFSISLGGVIIGEAVIGFLGYGIPPPEPSWGSLLSVEGKKYMLKNPWLAFWPGISLAIVVFGINMFGDALRDLLDPRLRGGMGRFVMAKKNK